MNQFEEIHEAVVLSEDPHKHEKGLRQGQVLAEVSGKHQEENRSIDPGALEQIPAFLQNVGPWSKSRA